MGSELDFPHPILIGGFGRSGTHAIGPLVGADPRYHLVETELRFHAVPGGLPDLLEGRIGLEQFVGAIWEQHWLRGGRRPQGLHRVIERGDLEAALERFRAELADDRWVAGRRLVEAIAGPLARRAGKPAWVELTGRCVIFAPTLLRVFPRARFINIVRDGRAVVGGQLRKIDMPDDPDVVLGRWERMIRASDAGIRAAPPGAVLQINLDDLVHADRERTFQRVVDFLELDDPGPMRAYFDSRISAERAHVGRWRERMPPPDARRVDRRYRRIVRRLRREGIDWVPEPESRRRPGLPR